MNSQGWFPLGWTGWIFLQSKGLSRVFSSNRIQKHQFFIIQPSLWAQLAHHIWLLEKPWLWLSSVTQLCLTLCDPMDTMLLCPWRTSNEGWAPKNWCFWNVVVEKTLESPLGYKIKSVNPKKNQPWILIGRTNAEAEAPILWPPDAKSQLIGKDPDAGKDWGHEEKGMTEDELVR